MKQQSSDAHPETRSQLSKTQATSVQLSLSSTLKDSEFPMPPLALAPSHKQGIRYPSVIEMCFLLSFFSFFPSLLPGGLELCKEKSVS